VETTFWLGFVKITRMEAVGHGINFSILDFNFLEYSGIEKACSILFSLLPDAEVELWTVVARSQTPCFFCHLGLFPDGLLGSFALWSYSSPCKMNRTLSQSMDYRNSCYCLD